MAQRTKKRSPKDIPVVILCGGKGTRLREETEIVPKPLVKVGEHPILWHIMKMFSAAGFNSFILSVGYKGEKIKEYFLHYQTMQGDFTVDFTKDKPGISVHTPPREKWKVTVVDTGVETESAARIKRIKDYIKAPYFLMAYGDGVSSLPIRDLLDFHMTTGKMATVAGVHPPARFGNITLDGDLAADFREKEQTKEGYINGGFFVLQKEVLDLIDDESTRNFSTETLPLLADKRELAVYKHEGYWQCMDTIRDMEFLNKEWTGGNAPWKTWTT